jgi:catechol 2,3-dioxygenase-like lactoylglutathione lyase family enzyme
MGHISVRRTDHTSFTVSDLDRSIRFFCEALDFELISKAGRDPRLIEQITGVPGAACVTAYVRRADHTVELIQFLGPDDRQAVRPRPCDTGFAHLCFVVEDMEAAVTAAGRYHMAPLGPAVAINAGPNKDSLIVYLQDPDGITIEFIQRPGLLAA